MGDEFRYNAQFQFWRNSAVGTLVVLTTLCCIGRYFDRSNSIRRRLPTFSSADDPDCHDDTETGENLGHIYAICNSICKAAHRKPGELGSMMRALENIRCDECKTFITTHQPEYQFQYKGWIRYCSKRPAIGSTEEAEERTELLKPSVKAEERILVYPT